MSRPRSSRAGSPTSLRLRFALFQALDDVPAERAGLRIVVRDSDVPGADVESHVPERSHHAVARVLAGSGLEALLDHPVDPRGRVVRVLGDQLVEILALPRAIQDLVRELLRLVL